ncbi:MAG: hypothetical protein R3B13_20665 [Polyangiaceae bacterium]
MRCLAAALVLALAPQCGGGDDARSLADRDGGRAAGQNTGGAGAVGGTAGAGGSGAVAGQGAAGADAGPPPPPPPAGDGYVPLHPYRALDTRGGALPAVDKPRCVKLAGTGTIPSDAKAIVINLTAVAPAAGGHLVAHAEGAVLDTSTLNFSAGNSVANGAIVSLGSGGKICVTPKVTGSHFIVDVQGFFAKSSGYAAITPKRLIDTRDVGLPAAGSAKCIKVTDTAGIAGDAVAVAVNVTAVAPSATGFLRLYPAGQTKDDISTLNFSPGTTIANGAVVAVGDGGQICVALGPTASHYLLDVSAYFAPSTRYHPVTPVRRLDTRKTTTPAANSTTCVKVSDAEVPASSRGVVMNLVAAKPSGSGVAVIYPDGHGKPSTSTLNFAKGQTIANNAIVQPGNGGRVCVHTSAATDLILDVTGYFASPTSGDSCASVQCVNPPPKVCSGGVDLVSYAAKGTCQHGTCIYADTAQMCLDGCSGNACAPTFGWDYNLKHRCIKGVSSGQANYYQDTTDCPVSGRNWTVAVQSEKTLQSSCSGAMSQSLPVNAGGPLTMAWVPHVDEFGRKNQEVILKSNFMDFAHPCGAGTYTWFTLMDHAYHGGGPNYPNPAEAVFHAKIWYDDWAPNGGSRLLAAYNAEWDGQGVMVEIDLQHVNWGDAYPSLPELVQKKVNASPPFAWVELDGKALGIAVPRKQYTEITIPWHSILSKLIAQGHLKAPSGGNLASGKTTAFNVATEVRNGGNGKSTVSAEARVTDFRISAK